ncbi:MAG: hypothetical protein GXY38_03050 [Planctomycetes bacterium]|nr:hypothetical protein [Planctomycetota bacterium]
MSHRSYGLKSHKKWWKRRRLRLLAAAAAVVLLVGPWPVNHEGFEHASYSIATRRRIAEQRFEPQFGQVFAGVGVAEITPPEGSPLAGYGGRKPNAAQSGGERMFVKTLTLAAGSTSLSIVCADVLLVLPELRHEILSRLQLPPDEVLFTATHTHSGPGGFAPGIVEQFVMGAYDPAHVRRMADAFEASIRASRNNPQPAMIGWGQCRDAAQGFVENRIDESFPACSTVDVLLVRKADDESVLATVVFACPHATCMGKRNLLPSRDYPGIVQDSVEEITGGACLFAAGAVGSMQPARNGLSGMPRARNVAQRVTHSAMVALRDASSQAAANAALAGRIIPVDLPPLQYRCARWARISPVVGELVLRGRETYIHAAVVGDRVILGMPADYSGELAMELAQSLSGGGPRAVVSSFNGDYIGYVIPHRRWTCDHYESRDMNMFGPWAGEYFNALAMDIMHRMTMAQESALMPNK